MLSLIIGLPEPANESSNKEELRTRRNNANASFILIYIFKSIYFRFREYIENKRKEAESTIYIGVMV
jgi:hypothetical protein